MPAFNGPALRGYEDLVTGVAKTEVGSLAARRRPSAPWTG